MEKENFKQYIKNKSVTILEQGIDNQVMIEFHTFKSQLTETELEIKNLDADIAKLQQNDISGYNTKMLLVKLSNIAEIKAYRALEKFVSKTDGELKNWAIVAMQRSRILIEDSLSDNEKVFIISGLGGLDDKLRYFTVINTNELETLTQWQKETIEKEIQYNAELYSAVVEEINFGDNYATITILIPIDKSIINFFSTAISNINELGKFISDLTLITNLKCLTKEEISDYLQNGPASILQNEYFYEIEDDELENYEFEDDEFEDDEFKDNEFEDDEFEDDEDFYQS